MNSRAHDYLDLDRLFSAEELTLRDRVRAFVAERIKPNIAGWYEAGHFPQELVKELGALGVLGMHLDGYGCAGTSATAYGLACTELEAGDSGLRSLVSVQAKRVPFFKVGKELRLRVDGKPWAPDDAAAL